MYQQPTSKAVKMGICGKLMPSQSHGRVSSKFKEEYGTKDLLNLNLYIRLTGETERVRDLLSDRTIAILVLGCNLIWNAAPMYKSGPSLHS